MRELLVLGLSWRTAAVDLRERLAFSDDEALLALADLCASGDVDEAMILSTCNRVEVYASTPRSAPESTRERAAASVRNYLAVSRGIDAETLSASLYEYSARDAAMHIFRVASSLESMVVGESQILGQLKDAYGRAVAAGTASAILARCLERAFRVAKRVRSETEIAKGAANVSSVAVELAGHIFEDLGGKSVLLLGAGKMGALAARHLRASGAGQVVVANRSIEKARELAAQVEGTARDWSSLEELCAGADVIISSTGSKEPILTVPLIKRALKRRRYRPFIIVDIAVPRDADPAIKGLEGVFLFNIDDLEEYVANNLRSRSRAAEAAGVVITAELNEFEAWSRQQSVVPTIRSLREHFSRIAAEEAERAAAMIAREPSEEKRAELTRRLGDRIAKKLLHAPMLALKSAEASEVDDFVEATRELFGLLSKEAARDVEPSGTEALAENLEPSPKKAE